MTNGKQILNNFFETFDVEYVFGNPGTTETTFLDIVANNNKCKFILALHEAVATGIAAGYALSSKKTAVLNIHTYPGLANAMANMYNAYQSGIPMLVIAGQQNRKHLIHNPNLSGNLVELASTATEYQYEVRDVSEMNIALQRAYLIADEAKVPTFLSIPMEIYEDECEDGTIKPTKVLMDTSVADITPIVQELTKHDGKKITFIVDSEVFWDNKTKGALVDLTSRLNCDVYLAPFPTSSVLDVNTPNYKGMLSSLSGEINKTLSQYEVVILLGESVKTFLYVEAASIPTNVTLIQFSNGNNRTKYNYTFDYVVRGTIGSNLEKLAASFKHLPVSYTGNHYHHDLKRTLLVEILDTLPKDLPIFLEGSSHSAIEDTVVNAMKFTDVSYEPRGGGLGWAMPMAVGVALDKQKHTVCLVGDGGSMYAIHSLWTAAHYNIPVIFICFVNHEYKILKQLWKLQVPESQEQDYSTVMNIANPELGLHEIASGFGAKVADATMDNYQEVMQAALKHNGPTFIMIPDDRTYTL